jgi:hypothetical protein
MKIKVCGILILSVVLYGCETRSLILRKERKLRLFENRVLRRIFGSRMDDVNVSGDNYIMWSLIICIPHPIFFR